MTHRRICISREPVDATLRKQLTEYVYSIVGCMHFVHEDIGPGLPEYVYQEALYKKLTKEGFETVKEDQHHPEIEGEPLEAFIKVDLMVKMPRGNVIIECKSIKAIGDKEQFQTFGYLRGTDFPIALLVNFGTWPKAQIERYYFHEGVVRAF